MQLISDRLSNRVPLKTLFWRDMIAVGAAINLSFFASAMTLAAMDWPIWSVLLVILVPLPYNVFIWHCVWKGAGVLEAMSRFVVRTLATGWLMLAVFI